MKRLSVRKDVKCMACLECVRACSTSFYKEFHPDKACLQIISRGGNAVPIVCTQCGRCSEVCEAGAIKKNAKGVYMISKKKCTGCGRCLDACPFGVIVTSGNSMASSKCIACGLCVKACQMDVLEIIEE